jgi:hypothetical protein
VIHTPAAAKNHPGTTTGGAAWVGTVIACGAPATKGADFSDPEVSVGSQAQRFLHLSVTRSGDRAVRHDFASRLLRQAPGCRYEIT